MYDDFAGSSSRPTTSANSAPNTAARAGRARGFSTTKKPGTDTFALGQFSHNGTNLGGIEVTRVVDVERDAGSAVHVSKVD